MASVCWSSKPLAMRPITLDGHAPLRYSRMKVTMSAALRPTIRGITESATFFGAWQPVQELAPGGASAAERRAGQQQSRARPGSSDSAHQAPFFSS